MQQFKHDTDGTITTWDAFYAKVCHLVQDEKEAYKMWEALPDANVAYDSKLDTIMHIGRVRELLIEAAIGILSRAINHDWSKHGVPFEKMFFDRVTQQLKGLSYGSPQYKKALEVLGAGLEHHYRNNSHHPEHYENGIDGMNIFDILEMFFDWKAAGERHANGCIYKSIEHNKDRFEMSPQLVNIFTNTAKFMNYKKFEPREEKEEE